MTNKLLDLIFDSASQLKDAVIDQKSIAHIPKKLYEDIETWHEVEVAKAKIEVLTKFKSDYADELSVDAYEELIEIISKLQAEASNE